MSIVEKLKNQLAGLGIGKKTHVLQVWLPVGASEAERESLYIQARQAYESECGQIPEGDDVIYIANFGTPGEPAPPSSEDASEVEESDRPPRDPSRDPAIQARHRRRKPEREPFSTTCVTDEPEELEDMHFPDRGFGCGPKRLPYKDGGRLDGDFFHRNDIDDQRELRRYAQRLAETKFLLRSDK